MKSAISKVLKAIIYLENQNIKPTIIDINNFLKSNFRQEYLFVLAEKGLIGRAFTTSGRYIFFSNINTAEYLHNLKQSKIKFIITISTFVFTILTFTLSLIALFL